MLPMTMTMTMTMTMLMPPPCSIMTTMMLMTMSGKNNITTMMMMMSSSSKMHEFQSSITLAALLVCYWRSSSLRNVYDFFVKSSNFKKDPSNFDYCLTIKGATKLPFFGDRPLLNSLPFGERVLLHFKSKREKG